MEAWLGPALYAIIAIIISLVTFIVRTRDFWWHLAVGIVLCFSSIVLLTTFHYYPAYEYCNVTTVNTNTTLQVCYTKYAANPHVVWCFIGLLLGLAHLMWAFGLYAYSEVSYIVTEFG